MKTTLCAARARLSAGVLLAFACWGAPLARADAAASATAPLEWAEKLLASTRLLSQPATHFIDTELSPVRDAASSQLSELDATERALREANRQKSVCDIHDIEPRSFQYPRSIWLFERNMRIPMFDANNGGYEPHPALYADLDGNGQIEAIVQLTKGATQAPVGDCTWRGKSSIFVFEMDARCAVHRLAEIKGTAGERIRIKGKSLLIDRPQFVSSGDTRPDAVCKESGVGHFVWQFKGGKLRSI
jgi:hypothetical protein